MYLHFSKKDSLKEIKNGESFLYNWDEKDNENLNFLPLGKFKKINLFIGANNSGKSRFMRSIIKSNFINQIEISDSQITFRKKIDLYNVEYHDLKNRLQHSSINTRSLNQIYNLIPKDIIHQSVHKNNIQKKLFIDLKNTFINLPRELHPKIKDLIFQFSEKTKEIIETSLFIKNEFPIAKKYIPILRTVHELKGFLNKGDLKEVIKNSYEISNDVYTGLELYQTILNLKNSPGVNRRRVKKFESFLSKNFFQDKTVELTSNSKKNELLFSVNEEEYPIYHLGDGIQSLILLLFPIFTAENDDWFFIEEPETNLHPGLQRVFIETLLNDEYLQSKNLKYFFTTHSNHFLDTSIQSNNISIFQFDKKEDNTFFIKTNVKPEKEVLDILGVNSSSVFLSNTSLWIEGPTDRKYISKFLKLYCKQNKKQPLKEDIDFAFFEYGGNLIEHYLFDNEKAEFNENEVREKISSFALSNKIFLLADNDNAVKNSKKDLRRKALEKLSKNNNNFLYQNTILKEIENLLPKKIIQDFMPELVNNNFSKEKSKTRKIKRSDYKNIGLGKFYASKFKGFIKKEHLKSFEAESGTLKNNFKIKLASFVVDSEYTYSDLIEDNEELKTIIENLYNFIVK